MGLPFWRSGSKRGRFGLAGFRIQSAGSFVIVLTMGFLLWVSLSLWGVAARCTGADEFWFQSFESDWPLGGMFFLIFSLLFVWNLFIAAAQVINEKQAPFLAILNLVLISGIMFTSFAALEAAEVSYEAREKTKGDWLNFRAPFLTWRQNPCVVARDYVGRWVVVEKDIPERGGDFPMMWIELRPSLTYRAADAAWASPYEGRWIPPSRLTKRPDENEDSGEIQLPDGFSHWDFNIDGEYLVLTTPDWALKWYEYSVVVLERGSKQ
jgi:hypothetical protein